MLCESTHSVWQFCYLDKSQGRMPAHTQKLDECGLKVEIMMTDPDIESLDRMGEKIQQRYLFIISCRNSHSHQFICTQSHLATSVSITMATPCFSPRSPGAICKCPLSFALPSFRLFIHFFRWHWYSFLHFFPQSFSPLPWPTVQL